MNFLLALAICTQLSVPYEQKILLDADGDFMIFARYYQGELISIDSIKNIDEYLKDGAMARNRKLLFEELKRDLAQQGGYTNRGLFGTFEIPLPKGGFSEFMGETGKLDVGGHVKITLGGSRTFIHPQPEGMSQSWLPELEMKQEMAINLDGQVGDRMRVFIDHNSERINESQNKITVTYKGREDEIIQEIEGGDTQLSIPATNYTGDIPSHSGLFGIKSTAKFGPLDIVAIASKEQTATQEIEIEGSTQAQRDTLWARYYERRRFFWIGTYDEIEKLQVYVDDKNVQNNNQGITKPGIAFVDVNDDNQPDTVVSADYAGGDFTLKREEFYTFWPGENTIELNYSLPDEPNGHVLAVYYTKRVGGTIDTVGNVSGDTVQLKLICPEQQDTASYTWNYEKKNRYQVVSPGSILDSLQIYYITSGNEHKLSQDGVQFIKLFDLDIDGDQIVDENRAFLSDRGILRFGDSIPMPFADSSILDYPDPELYTNPYSTEKGDYYFYIRTHEIKPVFALPENVETVYVFVDDKLQTPETDYHVDYDEGRIEFIKPIQPTQKVRVKVEYSPFFTAAEKSLVGVRGSLHPFGDAILGSSFFYRSESYPAEHVRLREEPFNRMIWEVDFNYPQKLPFLTRVVDWLPLVSTEAESHINVSAEGAFSFSNLNARGEVFLDDLESTTIISNEFSVGWRSWSLCSKPLSKDTSDYVHDRLVWYNPRDQARLQADDIYIDPIDPNEIADVLKIVFTPDSDSSFGGLMQYVYGENFDEVENLEIVVNGSNGVMHIDIGEHIPEDQLRRNKSGALVGFNTLDNEDADNNGVWTQQYEDTGLDTVYGYDSDYQEGGLDDGNDDYQVDDYTGGINGTEQNQIWDTEDLDRDGYLLNKSDYYSFSIRLDSTQYIDQNAGLRTGWKMFRIPLKDSTSWDVVEGQSDWHNIRYIRIWFDGFAQSETLLLYRLSGTGSRWRNEGIVGRKMPPAPSEVFTVTPVNTKTHSRYRSPYPEETDEFGQVQTEGGLELVLENIIDGHTCVAQRRTDDNEDYRAYDTLTFYLNAHHSDPVIALRIGSDSLNYYEFRTRYTTGIPALNEYRLFKVDMVRFVELKKQRENPEIDTSTVTDSIYTVVGRPSLSKNQFLEIRITNDNITPLTDTLWFNDVKLIAPRVEVGRIFRGNSSLHLADFANVSFSYDESNGRFRRLSELKEIATQSAGRGYLVNSNIALNKFLPDNWNFSIPVTASYRKTISEPRFLTGADDMEISGAEAEEYESRSVTKSYSIGYSKSGSKHWLLKHTLDNVTLNYQRILQESRAAKTADTSDMKSFQAAYSINPRFDIKFLGETFSPLPKSVSMNAGYSDNLARSYYRETVSDTFGQWQTPQHKKTLTPSASVTYSPHAMLSATYNFSQTRDSVGTRGRYGEEVNRNQNLNASLSRDLKIVTPRFSFNSSYVEDHGFQLRQTEDLRNVNNTSRIGVDGSVNVSGVLRFLARLRDESKDTLLATGSPAWFAKQLDVVASYISNPTVSFSRQRSSNYLNVRTRPSLEYQWGLVDSIPSQDVAPGSYPGRGVTDTYSALSGLNLRIITVNGGYSGMLTRQFLPDKEVRTQSASYPAMSVRLTGLGSLPFLKKLCYNSSLTSSFNQSFEEQYEVLPDTVEPDLTADSKTVDFNPLLSWQTTWHKGITSTIEVSYSETRGNDYGAGQVVPSKRIYRGGSANISYTFSAPKGIRLPFLGGLKFSSNMAMNLGVSYNRTSNFYNVLTQPTNDVSVISGNLGLSYNFSYSVTGGANIDYSQNKEHNSAQDTRRIGMNFWVNVNF
jgi:hypothetical protein